MTYLCYLETLGCIHLPWEEGDKVSCSWGVHLVVTKVPKMCFVALLLSIQLVNV